MVDWVTVAVSFVVSVGGSMIVTEYRLRREQSVEESAELSQWYDDAAGYGSQIQKFWMRNFENKRNPNLTKIQKKMSLFEGQVSRHATKGEKLNASQEVTEILDNISELCGEVADYSTHLNSMPDFEDFQSNIIDEIDNLEQVIQNRGSG